MTVFRYSRARIAGFLALAPLLFLFGFGVAATATDLSFFGGLLVMAMAAIWFVMLILQLFNAKPAVALSVEGLSAQRLGGKLVPWNDVAAVRLRWTKRRAFFVVPLNTPELAIDIPLDRPYWKSGGAGRAAMAWLSRLAEDPVVLVNLNGLAGGKPERVVEAARQFRADLVGETETRTAE